MRSSLQTQDYLKPCYEGRLKIYNNNWLWVPKQV